MPGGIRKVIAAASLAWRTLPPVASDMVIASRHLR